MPAIRRDAYYARRFWDNTQKHESGCWLWGKSVNQEGYGIAHVRYQGQVIYSAHRAAYILEHGEIPDGLHIDHLCRVRSCVNPDHLEAVTPAENNRRIPRGPLTKNRNFRCDDATYDAAVARADARLENISDVLRRALRLYAAGLLPDDVPAPTHQEDK